MNPAVLNDGHARVLLERVVHGLCTAPIAGPLTSERETAYTGRILQPWLQGLVAEIGLKGLHVSGDGGKGVEAAAVLGRFYYPDLTVHFRKQPVVAVEVKLAPAQGFQYSLCTAIGQSVMYRERFAKCAILLVDMDGVASSEEVVEARRLVNAISGIELVVRRRHLHGLEPCASPVG